MSNGVAIAAYGIEGSAHRTDGSKVDGTVCVSTSKEGETRPRDGWNLIEVGRNVYGKTVDVYTQWGSSG